MTGKKLMLIMKVAMIIMMIIMVILMIILTKKVYFFKNANVLNF